MASEFIGRESEIALLRQKNWRKRAILTALYGRRRVGKTALVEHAFAQKPLWKFEGVEKGNTKTQIQLFLNQLSHYSSPEESLHAADWQKALSLLDKKIKLFFKAHPDKALVIFFDEFQWLCEMKPDLVALFKYFWDNHFSKYRRCHFILCGSVSSFIVKKVLRSRALYGRIDSEINLQPLSIKNASQLLRNTRCKKEILDVYMVLGGIPYYYQELNPSFSLLQNINEYAFTSHGFFFSEFDRLFISHFGQNPLYEKILRSCAQSPKTPSALAKDCATTMSGQLTDLIYDLEIAGFVEKVQPVNKTKKGRLIQYKLSDEYLHFYFSFIHPHSPEIVTGNISAVKIMKSSAYRQWQGYAFERLCRKHKHIIADYLKFSAVDFMAGSWFNKDQLEKNAQIDLLFIRADKVLTICEIKHASQLNASKIISGFQNKIDVIERYFPAYAVEKVLIVAEKKSAGKSIARYFDHIIVAEQLFAGAK
jgi:AAA+ ATPase superfamily predicted ATPase